MPSHPSDDTPRLRRAVDAEMRALEVSLQALRAAVDQYSRARLPPAETPRPNLALRDASADTWTASKMRTGFGSRFMGQLRIVATRLFGTRRQRH